MKEFHGYMKNTATAVAVQRLPVLAVPVIEPVPWQQGKGPW